MSQVIGSYITSSKVLVTGASGFVGGHLAHRLLKLGAQVSLLLRNTSSPEKISHFKQSGANIIIGDITDRSSVMRAAEGQDYIFHCAALYREAKFDNSEYFRVNLEGSRNIIDAAAHFRIKRIVHTSTIGVHSHIKNPPANETEPYCPTDVYQESKTEAEKYARSKFESQQVNGSIIRPAMIWGEADTRFLKLFRGIANRKLPIIGSGNTWTHWIYVHDLVNAYLLAAEKEAAKGQIYIIAGRRPILLKDVFAYLAQLANTTPLSFKIPAWPIQLLGSFTEAICRPLGIEPPLHRRRCDFFIKNRWFDTSKAQLHLGFSPQQSFEEEANAIYNWYKQAGWL